MRTCVLALLVVVVAGCASANDDPTNLVISNPTVSLAAGRTKMVSAMGGNSEIAWTSDHPEIATVEAHIDGSATITAVAVGHANISAAMGQLAAAVDVTVTAAELDSITVIATRDMVPRGLTLQLTAEGTLSDKSTEDITDMVTWSAEDTAVATVEAGGLMTAVTTGPATIDATLGAATGTAMLTVTDATIASIVLAPTDVPSLAHGLTVQLVATGKFTDLSTSDVTDLVTFSSSNPAAVDVTHGGLATAVAASGTATITAMAGDAEATIDITASAAALESIALTPSPLALALGRQQQLTATGTYSDGTMGNVTGAAAWAIAAGTSVTVSPAGLAKAAAMGTSTVHATVGGVVGTVDIAVGAKEVDHLALTATAVTLMKQQRAHVKAALVYSDATTSDVTATATWTRAAGTTVTVAAGTLDAGTTAGATTFSVVASGQTATLVATVRSAQCHVVVNEVQSNGVTAAGDEWVELYNPCTASVDMTTWTLAYRAKGTTGASDDNKLLTGLGTIGAGNYLLFTGASYAGTAPSDGSFTSGLAKADGSVGLRSGPLSTGTLVDSLAYGAVTAGQPFIETAPADALGAGNSLARSPLDGIDTDDNSADFVLATTPTPRAANF